MSYSTVTDGYRAVYIKLAGNSLTWTNPGEQGVLDALTQYGIGVQSLHEIWSVSGAFYHEYEITIVGLNSQSDDEILSLVRTALDSVFSGIQVSVISSETASDWSVANLLGIDALKQAAKDDAGKAGISIGVIVAVALGALYLLTRVETTPVRYVKKIHTAIKGICL